jgi:MFS family permease
MKHSKEEYGMSYYRTDGTKGVRRAPFFLNPFLLPNAGISLSYFDVGIATYFWITPASYYLIYYLNADATLYSAFFTLVYLPWSLKFIFGLISDGIAILGYRRKSWMIIGWIIYVTFSIWLFVLGEPSITYIVSLTFFLSCAYLFSDVCTDTLCIERSRYEPDDIRGSFQTSGYTIRAFGCLIGALMGSFLYNTDSWGWGLTIGQIFLLNAFIPLTGVLPSVYHLVELAPPKQLPTFFEQLESLWSTLQLRAVWQPMAFIYIYYLLQVPNSAWTNFLIVGLDFTNFQIGMLTVAGAGLYWAGMVIYKQLLFETGWRWIYIYTTVVGMVFSLGQVSN